jgi:hypothetical protein
MADGLFKGIGSAFNRYIGGLLGEDVEKMTPEERRAARMAAIGIIGRGMVSPEGGSQALTAVRASRQAARDEQEMRRRQAAAEAALPDISSRIFGGRTGTMIEDVEGGPATPLMARRAPTAAGAREAIGMMYGTQAGRDVATMAPGLMTAAQEQMKPGEFVYQNVPGIGLVSVSKTNPSDVRIVQKVGREPAAPAKPELKAIRLANGMMQDMWIAPGQNESQGVRVGAPYVPKGADGETLNARQRTGVAMTQDAAVNYAVNVTGLPKAEIEKMSPAQVEAAIIKRGGRVLQGGTARIVSGLPVVGDFASTFVAAANADLLGPAAQGAAGIANLQNPSGTITGADLTAAGTQFPNAMMPIETQAQMIRSLLEQSRQIEQYDANGNKVR